MLEFDFSSSFRVFPFGLILFDCLFLLVAIPIEAYILNRRLKFDKRTSAFYAISINVFSNAIGWIIFFLLEASNFLENYKVQVLNFLLYNRINDEVYSSIILSAFMIFFGTFMIKFLLLRLFIFALNEPSEKKPEPKPEESVLVKRKSRQNNYRVAFQGTNLFTTTLIANSLSYSAITLVVLFRIFAQTDI